MPQSLNELFKSHTKGYYSINAKDMPFIYIIYMSLDQGWGRLQRHDYNYNYTMITKNDYDYNYSQKKPITVTIMITNP